jgi:hypothetical protein
MICPAWISVLLWPFWSPQIVSPDGKITVITQVFKSESTVTGLVTDRIQSCKSSCDCLSELCQKLGVGASSPMCQLVVEVRVITQLQQDLVLKPQ